jgi:hypothetical protein
LLKSRHSKHAVIQNPQSKIQNGITRFQPAGIRAMIRIDLVDKIRFNQAIAALCNLLESKVGMVAQKFSRYRKLLGATCGS